MRIYDISVPVAPGETPVFPGDPGIEVSSFLAIARGDAANVTALNFGAHTGTHVDAPAHFIAGTSGVESLSLETLIGPARVVEIPKDVRDSMLSATEFTSSRREPRVTSTTD